MRGDFSRISFDASRHYTRVLRQQGRVDLDADHNEESAIIEHLQRARDRDALGAVAAPHERAGFMVGAGPSPEDLTISAGHLYVDGIWCEAGEEVSYLSQESLPDPEEIEPADGRTDLVYLDVWQRHVTALEDGDLREVALGGPDTATRVQTVWQVRVRADVGADASCAGPGDWPPAPTDAQLTTGTTVSAEPDDPCLIAPGSVYRGVENHLYRVEIHKAGTVNGARFKWSRDNASLSYAIREFLPLEPNKIRLTSLGKDAVTLLRKGDWVEIVDDHTELGSDPGFLVKVDDVDETSRVVRLDENVPSGRFSPDRHPRLRRWDQIEGVQTDGSVKTSTSPIELELGVEVTFSGDDFRVGDYWIFAARTATGQVESLASAPPHGVAHRYAKLALITWSTSADGLVPEIHDCRPKFPSLTEMVSLHLLGGDGQEVMPDLTDPSSFVPLPHKLLVGVSNGEWPVGSARVRFDVEAGNGTLAGPDADNVVETDGDGIASVAWALNPAQTEHRVLAALLDDADNEHHLPVRFTATLSVASQVAYDPGTCAPFAEVLNVQDAIDRARAIAHLYRVCGDGQEAKPGEQVGPVQVLVANGCGPVQGAQVRYEVVSGGGSVTTTDVTTGADGLAQTTWRLGTAAPDQQLRATLQPSTEVLVSAPSTLLFNANLSVATEVGYDPADASDLVGVTTVKEALDELSRRGGGGSCTVSVHPGDDLQAAIESLPVSGGQMCMAAGIYELPRPLHITKRARVRIVGCGPSTVIRGGHEVCVVVRECHTVELRGLRVESGGMGTAPGEQHLMGAVTFLACTDVTVADCELRCRESVSGRGQCCLAIHGDVGSPRVERCRVEGNRLEVGANQVGLLVGAPRILHVVRNHVVPATLSFQHVLTHAHATVPKTAHPFEQGIVVGGGAGLVHVIGNVVEQAVQGIHIGAWRDRQGPIAEVLLDSNTVFNRIPADYARERHAVYVSGARSMTVTDTFARCSPVSSRERPVDAIRLMGNLGPYLRVVGADLAGYSVGVRVQPEPDPGEGGMDQNMWFVGDILASGAFAPALLSPAVRTGILVN